MANLISPEYTALLQALPSPILASTSTTFPPTPSLGRANTSSHASPPEGTPISIPRQRRARTRFDDADTALLAAAFAQTAYPDYRKRKELAEKLGVSEARIAVWFQNRRTRVRKARCLEPGTPGPHSSKSQNVFSLAISHADTSTHSLDSTLDPLPTASLDPLPTASLDPLPTASLDPLPTASLDPLPTSSLDQPRNASTSSSDDDTSSSLDLSSFGLLSRKRALDGALVGYERRVKPRFGDMHGGVVFPSPQLESIEENIMSEAPTVIGEGVRRSSVTSCTADADAEECLATDDSWPDVIVIAPCASIDESSDNTVSSSQDTVSTRVFDSSIDTPHPFDSTTAAVTDQSASTSIDSGRGTATPRDVSPTALSASLSSSGDENCEEPLDLSVSRDYNNHSSTVKMASFLHGVSFSAPPPPPPPPFPMMMFPPAHGARMQPWLNRVHYGAYLQALAHLSAPPRFVSPAVYPDPR